MPIYEYRCEQCDRRFEELVRGEAQPSCPSCSSARVKKLHSVFATSNGKSQSAVGESFAGGCPSCGDPRGPGSCALN